MKLWFAGMCVAFFVMQSGVEAISNQIFIGQAYPSGNVYLKMFSSSRSWPQEVSLVPLASNGASFKATLKTGVVPAAYIPAIEGMDDQHDVCGSIPPRKLDPAFKYLSEDFFNAMVDHCETNEEVALYRTSSSQASFSVLGFASAIALMNIRSATGLRPMTSTERQSMLAEKNATQPGCATEPAFMDSATRLLEADIGDGLAVRLSSYRDPGCAGHLATIYILDVLRMDGPLRTFQLIQPHGVL